MWIVSGCVGLPVILFVGIVIVFGLMFSGAFGCPAFLGCEDWGQVSRGDSYAEEGQYEMAIQEYDEAIRLERDDADAYYKRGLAHEALGKTKEARRDFESAIQEYDEIIRTNPYAYSYYQRALTYKALGKTKEAEQDFESAIQEYDETIRTNPDAYSYYQRALTYKALGMTIEAERDFAKAKELGYPP
jgi:tetratricopeptide (TPR) repeat protein